MEQYFKSSARCTVYNSVIMAPSFLVAFTLITFGKAKVFLIFGSFLVGFLDTTSLLYTISGP